MQTFLPKPISASMKVSVPHLTQSSIQKIQQKVPTVQEPIFVYKDVDRIKNIIQETIKKYNLSTEYAVILVAEELMVNVLKYAENGLISLYISDNLLYMIVEDRGPGVHSSILMEAIQSPSFSSPHTLGHGLHRVFVASEKFAFYSNKEVTVFTAVFSMINGCRNG
ncbi:anti-sigma regulatory factor (Ser/Thr protein kinase) [Salibacterium salarium]|uniref:ATP-binding protein n=1 Tax=Salibacterium salarium TaxID=284579 RepID=UPI002788F600|nr:hypothetical protein [Salibacterium salarium]MDQ0298761.1 anti-sigma regulatory factor (Ser/Thr protein kinase) [Salibacterium salarium]